MRLTKILVLAACVAFASNSQIKAAPGGAMLVGACSGYTTEKLLYNLPVIISIPGVLITWTIEALALACVAGKYEENAIVSGITGVATMLFCYMLEKEKTVVRKEEHVIIMHTPYPQYVQQPNVVATPPAK